MADLVKSNPIFPLVPSLLKSFTDVGGKKNIFVTPAPASTQPGQVGKCCVCDAAAERKYLAVLKLRVSPSCHCN